MAPELNMGKGSLSIAICNGNYLMEEVVKTDRMQKEITNYLGESYPEKGLVQRIVRYGIIGVGMMGREHLHNLAVVAGAEISAAADPHKSSRDRALKAAGAASIPPFQVFPDYNSLLDSGLCDVVVVATPNMTHKNIILDILAHPRPHHILVEKPLCTTVADCKEVIAAANARKGVLVQVGLEYRYMAAISRLIQEVKAGTIGRVCMVSIREHRYPFLVKVGDWNRFNKNTGGTLVEKCCHFFDLMTLIAGARPLRVIASGSQSVNHLQESYEGQVPDILDNAYVIVDYEGGVRGLLDLCMFAEGSSNEQELAVVGDAGKIEAHVPDGVVRIGKRGQGRQGVETIQVHDDRIKYEGLHHGSSYLEHLDFIAAVRSDGKRPPAVSLEEGLLSVAIGVAAQLSIQLARPVLLEEVLNHSSESVPL
eukprot:jgi/Mesen1/6324/ME000326S05457